MYEAMNLVNVYCQDLTYLIYLFILLGKGWLPVMLIEIRFYSILFCYFIFFVPEISGLISSFTIIK